MHQRGRPAARDCLARFNFRRPAGRDAYSWRGIDTAPKTADGLKPPVGAALIGGDGQSRRWAGRGAPLALPTPPGPAAFGMGARGRRAAPFPPPPNGRMASSSGARPASRDHVDRCARAAWLSSSRVPWAQLALAFLSGPPDFDWISARYHSRRLPGHGALRSDRSPAPRLHEQRGRVGLGRGAAEDRKAGSRQRDGPTISPYGLIRSFLAVALSAGEAGP